MPDERDLDRRAHALLFNAIELDPSLRRGFVEQECADDHRLLGRVLRLLDAAERADTFLESPAIPLPPPENRPIPDAVGNYLVVGVLGVGGMATVYEAVQDQPRRSVALKVLNQSMTGTDAYLRFLFETETLARLRHPGIAQIYEAGVTKLDRSEPAPFYAMELVPDAVTITRYAELNGVSLRDRVRMFTAVCDAVHHGHQQGIVHRDIKPGNVLVDSEGRVKVIDFGVARNLDASAVSLTAITDASQLIGTLNSMSPEQCVANARVDTRTDVYSLGVLLFELCCGHLPHDLGDLPLPAALNRIMNEPPRRPTLPRTRECRDLEAIILKAIEKDPDRRYDGAAVLATDLRHWLDHKPTEARPPGVGDQFLYFARRNPGLVTAAASVFASILLIAMISTVFAWRLADEVGQRRTAEQRAEAERDEAQWQAYTAQISGALSALKTGEFQQMRTRLTAAEHPKRGWEWGFLSNLADRSARTVHAHNDMIMDLAVDRGWSRLATSANDGTIRVWNASDGSFVAGFVSESGARIAAVDFSPDGNRLVAGDDDGVIRLFHTSDLREIEQIATLPAAVRSVCWLPNDTIGAAAADGSARVWKLGSMSTAELPDDQPGGIRGIHASPDGALIATFNDAGHVWIRDSADHSVLHKLEFPGAVNQVRFSSDSAFVAAAGAQASLYIWDLSDGALLRTIEGTGGINTIRSLAFSNNGEWIVAGLIHRGIVVASVRDGQAVVELGGHTEAISGLRFSPDDAFLVSASWDRTLRTWRTEEFTVPSGLTILDGHESSVRGIAFSPDGSVIASVSQDGTIGLWEPDLATPIARLGERTSPIYSLAFSPDSARIATANADRIVRLWDTSSGAVTAELTGNELWVASVAFDPTGGRVAGGGQDGGVRIWEVDNPEPRLLLHGHQARVNSVDFSPDGATLASGSRDKSVRLWDTRTGEELFRLTDHESDVFAVLFSKDGARLFTGSRDQSVRVWDVRTGTLIKALTGHGQYVTCLALNPDATRLAAGSWFGEIVLFDVETLDQIASFRAHEAAIRGISFSPDGRWLASGSLDSTIRIFDSASRQQRESARLRAGESLGGAVSDVRAALQGFRGPPEAVVEHLERSGLHTTDDPWVRKALLTTLWSGERPP